MKSFILILVGVFLVNGSVFAFESEPEYNVICSSKDNISGIAYNTQTSEVWWVNYENYQFTPMEVSRFDYSVAEKSATVEATLKLEANTLVVEFYSVMVRKASHLDGRAILQGKAVNKSGAILPLGMHCSIKRYNAYNDNKKRGFRPRRFR